MALEVIYNRELEWKIRNLHDSLLRSISCRVGLLVTDAGGDGRKAGKIEAAILSSQNIYWPKFFSVVTREEMKIAEISPQYLVLCKVLELDAKTEKSVKHKSERVKTGTKRIPNPNYLATKDAYERANQKEQNYSQRSGLSAGLGKLSAGLDRMGAEMALGNTPMYLEDDVYETRLYTVTKYQHAASISLNTRITESATSVLIGSVMLSDSDVKNSNEAYGVDLLSPLTLKCCNELAPKIVTHLTQAYAEIFLQSALKTLNAGEPELAVESFVKALIIYPERGTQVERRASSSIENATRARNITSVLRKLR